MCCAVARGVMFDIQNLLLVIQHKTSNFLYGNIILLYCMCSFQFLQGIYIRNLNKKKDAVIGQKDGYVLRLTRAFTRQ
jgi:hypothetical protein